MRRLFRLTYRWLDVRGSVHVSVGLYRTFDEARSYAERAYSPTSNWTIEVRSPDGTWGPV